MNKTVDQFEWDAKEDWSPEDFFKLAEDPKPEVKTKVEAEAKPTVKPIEEEDPFADLEELEEEEEEESESKDPKPTGQPTEQPTDQPTDQSDEDEDVFTLLAKDLHELGYLPEVKGKYDAASILDSLEASLEDRIDKGIEQVIEGWKEQIGDLGHKFIQYTMNNGDPNEFFSMFSKQSIDVSTERGQELFLRDYLISEQGMDAEDVDVLIETYKENETLEKYAKKYHAKVQQAEQAEQARILAENEQRKAERDQAIKAFNDNLKKVAKDTDHIMISARGKELGKINFTEVEKRSLVNYITQNTVPQNGRYISEFTKDFNNIYQKQPEKLLLIAKLLKSDFDLSDLVQNQVTEKVKEVKSNLQRIETKKKTKTKTKTDRPVWEYFQ